MDLSKLVIGGVGVAVVLILSSRSLSSFWTTIYRLFIGAVATGACLFVMQRFTVEVGDETRWIFSVIVGALAAAAASGIPWL